LKPFQPSQQDAGADGDHHQVARHRRAVTLEARADDGRGHEGGHTGREVDDVTTGVVNGTLLGEEATTPQQRGVDAVHESDPQRHDEQPRLELQTSNQATEEEQRGNGREDELKVGEGGRSVVELQARQQCAPEA
jgi:hypothetical protein